MLTAQDGAKWKKVQLGEQSTSRLASHNNMKECHGPSSYARRNIQVQVLRVPGYYLLTSILHLTST